MPFCVARARLTFLGHASCGRLGLAAMGVSTAVSIVPQFHTKSLCPDLSLALRDLRWSPNMGSMRGLSETGRRGRDPLSLKLSLCETVLQLVILRARAVGHGDAICAEIERHFACMPPRYAMNVDPMRHEDILLHIRLLREAREAEAGAQQSQEEAGFALPSLNVRRVIVRSDGNSNQGNRQNGGISRSTSEREGAKGMPIPAMQKPAFGSSYNLAILGSSSPSIQRAFGHSRSMKSSSPGVPSTSMDSPGRGSGGAAIGGLGSMGSPSARPVWGLDSPSKRATSGARASPSGEEFSPRLRPLQKRSSLLASGASYTSLSEMDADCSSGDSGQERGGGGAGSMGYAWEVTVASADRHGLMKLLTSALCNAVPELDIKEAHVFSTSDGLALEVFVLDGWKGSDRGVDEAEELRQAILAAICNQLDERPLSPRVTEEQRLANLKATVNSIAYEDWSVDYRDLQLRERLGSGSSGRLYRGVYRGQDVAVKVITVAGKNQEEIGSGSLKPAPVEELLQLFKQEVAIMRVVRHKNIVQFIGACSCWPRLFIVTELMERGSVSDVLQNRNGGLDPVAAVKVLRDAARGLDFLHRRGVVHRDVKAANLLIDEHDVVKLCDFGVARMLPSPVGGPNHVRSSQEDPLPGYHVMEMTAETGTYRWMAPEVLEHKPYGHKVDVYSFGITIWEVLTGEVPYAGLTPLQAAIGVVQRGLRPELGPAIPSRLANLAKRCWEGDANLRPEMCEVLSSLEAMLKPGIVWKRAIGSYK
eukprot:TRINITY_DN816_c1_g5_i1.p1 TRINITY_DN816_c1_g5~~TRINITY_DN816_c1_g5_i1.p1  ORF type:complete len:761 (-),score=96.42 TRINITY_DN816_c1_g5_i1:1107-3389(-)